MDAKTFIQQQMVNVRNMVEDAMTDLTEDQFNWQPPGKVNPISATLIHLFSGEDMFIQELIQGKPQGWELQGWSKKIGIQSPPGGPGNGWEDCKNARICIEPVMAYGRAIWADMDAYLAEMSAEELDRQVNFFGRMLPVAELLMIIVVHSACHAGEIAAVKGMQGIKGWSF